MATSYAVWNDYLGYATGFQDQPERMDWSGRKTWEFDEIQVCIPELRREWVVRGGRIRLMRRRLRGSRPILSCVICMFRRVSGGGERFVAAWEVVFGCDVPTQRKSIGTLHARVSGPVGIPPNRVSPSTSCGVGSADDAKPRQNDSEYGGLDRGGKCSDADAHSGC
ncbi:hypothetical protein [Nocardia asteroides]|uniref:hypothetical protein n=1 Tax=Nocardia asteroides TaxID=1824 RepID=UPI0033FD621D